MRIIDLRDVADHLERAKLLSHWVSVYRIAFPIRDEAEDPDVWPPLLDAASPNEPPLPELHIAVAMEEGNVLGGLNLELYRESGTWLLAYIAVRADGRGSGIGRRLLESAIELSMQARTADRESSPPILLAEAEDPERALKDGGFDRSLRLRILSNLGFRIVDMPYVQPPLGAGRGPVDWLFLLAHQSGLGPDSELESDRLHRFLHEFYRAQSVTPEEDADFREMSRWLETRRRIGTMDLAGDGQ